jgi:hypothetical protein
MPVRGLLDEEVVAPSERRIIAAVRFEGCAQIDVDLGELDV